MASPLCTVQDGAGSPQVTSTGYASVTPTATATIALADATGVGVWSITCIATDETTVASTITASLTVNYTNKTATFTAPAAGKAMLFRSQVNGGRDQNGENLALTTTFKVATLTAGSLVVAALNEELEHSSTFGWMPIVNGIVRSGSAVGWTSIVDLDFTTASTQNLLSGGDGAKTVSGQLINFTGGANCSAADVTNGTGLRYTISTTGTAQAVNVDLRTSQNTAMAALFPWNPGIEYELTSWVTAPTLLVTNEELGAFFYEATADVGRAGVGYKYSAAQKAFYRYQDPLAGAATTGTLSAAATTDDVFQIRSKSATYVEMATGLTAGSVFPPTTIRTRGTRSHTVEDNQWVAPANHWRLYLGYLTGTSSCAGRVVTIKRMRVRARLLA